MDTLRVAACLLLLAAQAGVAPELQAQQGPPGPGPSSMQVVGFSYIQPPNGGTIVAYAATDMGADVAAYYDAEVDAYLTQSNQLVADGSAGPTGPTAEGVLYASSAAAQFQLVSDHYLVSYDEDYEYSDWVDPWGFQFASPDSEQGAIIVDAPLDVLDPYSFSNNQYIYMGSTWWQEYGTAPQINGITSSDPNGLVLGGNGTLTITGLYLTAGGNDPGPTASVARGTGLTLGGVQVESDSQLDVSYTIDSSLSSTGSHGITVTTVSGTSNSSSIQVGDPPPTIKGYTPASPWLAGNVYSLSVTGTGFGTNPSLSITGVAGLSYSVVGSTDTNISATVTIDASSSGGTASITVTSNGYSGSGNNFVESGSGDSPTSGAALVEVDPAPQLSCTPETLMRGASVSCTVSSGTVTQWSFSGTNSANTVLTVTGPNGGSGWSGVMVLTGTVTATVQGVGSLTRVITVNPRSNFSVSSVAMPPTPTQLSANGTAPMDTLQSPTVDDPQPTLSESGYAFQFNAPTQEVSGGPNDKLFYVTSLTDQSSYVWELNPGLANPNDPFYKAQGPAYGTCWAGASAIIAAAQLHEYGTVPGQPSHYTEVRDFLAQSATNPGTKAEGAVGASDADLNKIIGDAYAAALAAGAPEPQGGAALPSQINFPPYVICQ